MHHCLGFAKALAQSGGGFPRECKKIRDRRQCARSSESFKLRNHKTCSTAGYTQCVAAERSLRLEEPSGSRGIQQPDEMARGFKEFKRVSRGWGIHNLYIVTSRMVQLVELLKCGV